MKKRYLAGIALAASLLTMNAAQAQTISYADAMTTLAQECGADIHKVCKGVNLGGNKIADCLAKHSKTVSPQCLSTLASVQTSIATRLAAQASVFKVCAIPANQYCSGLVGETHVLHCLIKVERLESATCKQAIVDAGWR